MDSNFDPLEWIRKLPELLVEYSTFSYSLLGVLLAAGVVLLVVHVRRRGEGTGLPAGLLSLAILLVVLSLGGLVLHWSASHAEAQRVARFVEEHRAPAGEHWLLVVDFRTPEDLEPESRERYHGSMDALAATIREVLLEDLPEPFEQPKIVALRVDHSPWRDGVGQENVDDVLHELNAFEALWGDVIDQGRTAKAFLGISRQVAAGFDTVIPLRDFPFNDNPSAELQFSDGRYRLLGLVTFTLALDTCKRAGQAAGEDRRALFLQAGHQLAKARERMVNRRSDPVLERTLFSERVDELIAQSQREALGSPPP